MKIFAYGTLKKGGILHKHMDGAEYLRRRKIHGYVLYLAPDKTYPLLYYTGDRDDVVVGEVWKINKDMKHKLDEHEEGYVLKRLLRSPIMTYYPNFDIKHLCNKIPKNKHGKYDFNVEKDFYKNFDQLKILDAIADKRGKNRSEKKAKAPKNVKIHASKSERIFTQNANQR